jgi:hypothetical protein
MPPDSRLALKLSGMLQRAAPQHPATADPGNSPARLNPKLITLIPPRRCDFEPSIWLKIVGRHRSSRSTEELPWQAETVMPASSASFKGYQGAREGSRSGTLGLCVGRAKPLPVAFLAPVRARGRCDAVFGERLVAGGLDDTAARVLGRRRRLCRLQRPRSCAARQGSIASLPESGQAGGSAGPTSRETSPALTARTSRKSANPEANHAHSP